MGETHTKQEVLESPLFRDLARKKDAVCLSLTAVTLAIYFGFISLVALRKDLLALKPSPNVSLGILIGIGVIVASWALTGVYAYWATHHYDRTVREVLARLGEKP
jgi:uncharacterized membrane protein (DUF485 family)